MVEDADSFKSSEHSKAACIRAPRALTLGDIETT